MTLAVVAADPRAHHHTSRQAPSAWAFGRARARPPTASSPRSSRDIQRFLTFDDRLIPPGPSGAQERERPHAHRGGRHRPCALLRSAGNRGRSALGGWGLTDFNTRGRNIEHQGERERSGPTRGASHGERRRGSDRPDGPYAPRSVFHGTIEMALEDSEPDVTQPLAPPGARNVLLIMGDDVGS